MSPEEYIPCKRVRSTRFGGKRGGLSDQATHPNEPNRAILVAVLQCRAAPCHTKALRTVPCHATPCRAVPHQSVPAVPCCAVRHHVAMQNASAPRHPRHAMASFSSLSFCPVRLLTGIRSASFQIQKCRAEIQALQGRRHRIKVFVATLFHK